MKGTRAALGMAALGAVAAVGDGLVSRAALRPAEFLPLALWYVGLSAGGGVVLAALFRRRAGAILKWRRLPIVAGSVLVAVLAVAIVLRLASGEEAVPPPVEIAGDHPPVLFILVDTLRADHTTLGGYARDTTPHLARFARRGAAFTAAQSVSSWTKPSVASLLTGLSPGQHRTETKRDALPPAALTLAEVLGAAGYDSLFVSDNPWVSERFGYSQGFGEVHDLFRRLGVERFALPRGSLLGRVAARLLEKGTGWLGPTRREPLGAEGINARFLSWLDSREAGSPWLAYLHYMEPHDPYTAPATFATRYSETPRSHAVAQTERGLAPFRKGRELPADEVRNMVAAYDAEIAYFDDRFGDLLRSLETRGVLDECLVVVVGDHGEAFYDRGIWNHGNGLIDALVHVPLVIRGAGVPAGTCERTVSTVGLPATVVRLAGYEPPGRMTGGARELLPAPDADQPCYQRLNRKGILSLALREGPVAWIYSTYRGEERMQRLLVEDDAAAGVARHEEDGARVQEKLLRHAANEEMDSLDRSEAEITSSVADTLRSLGYLR